MMMITKDRDHMGIPIQAHIEALKVEEDVAESSIIIDQPRNIVCNLHLNLSLREVKITC